MCPWPGLRSSRGLLDNDPPVRAGVPQTLVHSAPGLRMVLAGLDGGGPQRVLDLGPAIGANVTALGRRAARLQIVDCFREEVGGAMVEAVDRLRAAYAGSFDVALAWHLLNYLSHEAAANLVRRVAGLCRPGARLHALIFETETMPASPGLYRIVADDRVRLDRTSTDVVAAPDSPPAVVESLLPGFNVEHAFVLNHGTREYVAERTARRLVIGNAQRDSA